MKVNDHMVAQPPQLALFTCLSRDIFSHCKRSLELSRKDCMQGTLSENTS